MAFLYKPRGRGNFSPEDKAPFRISRSKVDLFLECPRCFYLDQRLGITRPQTFPLTLNIAVDELLKKEFDLLRDNGDPHPIMSEYGIDAVPLKHPDLEAWRDAMRRGIEYVDPKTNLSVRGGVDDVWVRPNGELLIVDYKAKATREEITLDGDLGDQYKRQIEVYQWLFRKNGFQVSNTAYFVFVNGKKDAEKFDGKLEFDMSIIAVEGDTSWIDGTIPKIKECLIGDLPVPDENCAYCNYRKYAAQAAVEARGERPKKEVKAKYSISKKEKNEETKQTNIFGESF